MSAAFGSTWSSLKYASLAYANTIQFSRGGRIYNREVHSRMLLWCDSGEGVVRANGNQYILNKGRFLILPWKHDVHYSADRINPYKLGGAHIIPYYSPSLAFKPAVAHNSSDVWWEGDQLSDRDIPGLDGIMEGSFNSGNGAGIELLANHSISLFHRESIDRCTASALALLLLKEIIFWASHEREKESPGEAQVFEKIAKYTRENLTREISLDDLCTVGAVSRSTLRRVFLKKVQAPPHEWILQLRLERARYLLRTTSQSIESISHATGFRDASYFTRLFHRREGKTPGRYRSESLIL